ncbi:MBL fold metallo-hydrolase [Flavobacterium sp. 20NA77.7]|uniref:MBL fold metallo-hydrolase n=1 Tax=Flavobacterium nakdongensis TaxID=3073563 RepID=A0ABY9RCA3_9FLAO|nr:MBL fold metallo-hydrolase [Flavobacterium sp. 20NA77.7]WMW78240.1 MBL fold metallo-hydrolase [Flavobacterium sp. 20NA77.7]
MKIHFLGAAGTVTGSKIVIQTNGLTVLVDCGMFQGLKALRELNRGSLEVAPATIDYVIVTHGHLDHCGWLPKLVNDGFSGKIFCSHPTKEIIQLILQDSAKIQEEEAEMANKYSYSKHNPALPLYTTEDVEKVIPLFKVVLPHTEIKLTTNSWFRLFYAGHIIGACSLELYVEGKTIVFSGDIGQDNDVLMFPPEKPKHADYIFLESTYGNRIHPKDDVLFQLETILINTYAKKGNVVIPSFAVERVQTIMYLLWQLKKQNKIPDIKYVIDTPMGISVLDVFKNNTKWHKLTPSDIDEMCDMFTMISNFEDTIKAIYDKQPKVIIAASGMITGGRVLAYLERYISESENTVVLVGYQAEGTRGRRLLEGEKELKFHGKYFPVLANISSIEGLSAHGDQENLIQWLSELDAAPKKVFLIHGENIALDGLRLKIIDTYGYVCQIPTLGQVIDV